MIYFEGENNENKNNRACEKKSVKTAFYDKI